MKKNIYQSLYITIYIFLFLFIFFFPPPFGKVWTLLYTELCIQYISKWIMGSCYKKSWSWWKNVNWLYQWFLWTHWSESSLLCVVLYIYIYIYIYEFCVTHFFFFPFFFFHFLSKKTIPTNKNQNKKHQKINHIM